MSATALSALCLLRTHTSKHVITSKAVPKKSRGWRCLQCGAPRIEAIYKGYEHRGGGMYRRT